MAVDGAGNLFVAQPNGHAVYEVLAASGYTTVNQLATGFTFSFPFGVAVDGTGNVFVADAGNNAVYEILSAGGYTTVKTLGSGFSEPYSVAVDANDNVFVGDYGHQAVKEITAASNYATIKTLGGSSHFNSTYGIAVDGTGNVFIPYWNGSTGVLAEITAASNYTMVNTLISGIGQMQNVTVDGKGNLYVAVMDATQMLKLDLADAPTLNFGDQTLNTTSSPQTVTLENIGNVDLSFPVPASGNNPSIATGFTLDSGNTGDCPLVTSGASSPGTLTAGASCTLPISFAPTSVASYDGSTLAITDDSLNAPSPNYTTQTITLNGTGAKGSQNIAFTDSLPTAAIYNGVNLQYTISATGGGSGNPVTFSLDGASTAGIASLVDSALTISGAGTVIIDAAQAGNANYQAGSAQQTIMVTLDTPATIAVYSGNRQSTRVGSAFTNNLTAQATDVSGAGVYGVTVTFAVPSPGASATLSPYTVVTDVNGMASVTATANATAGAYQVTASYPGSGFATFGLTNLPPPVYTVTTLVDDATGTAANCNDTSTGATPNANCSLRDAIAAAAAISTATTIPTITFASSLNLTTTAPGDYNVTTGGALNIANNMNIVGPGANQLSIDGGNAVEVFDIASGTVSISSLTITNGSFSGNGAGISNSGTLLTVSNCTISNNTVTSGSSVGGGIFNAVGSTLMLTGSTIINNTAQLVEGGGIANGGTATVINSTFTGNSAPGAANGVGGAIATGFGGPVMTIVNSTISGNTAVNGDAGIYGFPTMYNDVITDSTLSGVPSGDGNVTSGVNLASLGNYGGPTQTMPSLPGSAAICAGLVANVPSGITTDQRGNPRSTMLYGDGTTACVDAGAVQSAYSLAFTTSPSASQQVNVAFTPAPLVQLYDNGSAINLPGAPIALAIYSGAISGGVPTVGTASNGVSTFSGVTVATSETGDYLIARAPVGPYSIAANSSNFNIVAITLSPAAGPLSAGAYGAAYSQQFTASNGTAPYSYTATGLPSGLSINLGTGLMSGTPTVPPLQAQPPDLRRRRALARRPLQ